MTQLLVSDLTEATISGSGVFDVLMRANKAHLDEEFLKNRIKGPEFATVYLGSMEAVMSTALSFLLQQQKTSLEADLMAQQILLAQAEILKANAQVALVTQQTANALAEYAIITANATKTAAEITHLAAQTAMVTEQTHSEAFRNFVDPVTPANSGLLEKERVVLIAQACKLDAEWDLTKAAVIKSASENLLMVQKIATEKAQILTLGVDEDSVIGKQKALYAAQTAGFTRDAEQKAAKVLVDSWSVRKTVDVGTKTDEAGLGDTVVTRAVNKLLTGVGA